MFLLENTPYLFRTWPEAEQNKYLCMPFLCNRSIRTTFFNAILLLFFVSLSACGLNGSSSGGGGSSEAFPPIVEDMEAYTPSDYSVIGILQGHTNELNFPPDLEDFMRSPISSPYSYNIVEGPELGTVKLTTVYFEWTGEITRFRYTPHEGTAGVDTFAYTLTDPFGTSEPGIVTVTIGPETAPAPPIPAGIERVSVSDDLAPANGGVWRPTLDGTGRHVAFISEATNLTPDTPEPAIRQIFVRDLDRGTTERVQVRDTQYAAKYEAGTPVLSDDGHRISFSASGIPLGDNDYYQTYVWNVLVHNLRSGKTEVASRNTAGDPGNSSSFFADLSASGQYVAFFSVATDLLDDPVTYGTGIYLRDLKKGTTRLLPHPVLDGATYYPAGWVPQVSGKGRFITFSAHAAGHEGDVVFLHDTADGSDRPLAVGPTGVPAQAFYPTISADGAWAAYFSANSLDPTNISGATNAYLEEIATGKITLMRVDTDRFPRLPPLGLSVSISGDGRFSVFTMKHINQTISQFRVHLFDRETGEAIELMRNAQYPVISTDGNWITFLSDNPELAADSPDNPSQIYVVPNPLAGEGGKPVDGDVD